MGLRKSVLERYKTEILTFADDANDINFDLKNGSLQFMRLNQVMDVKILQDDNQNVVIEYNEQSLPYKTFLAKYLGNLDLMARRIKEKHKDLGDDIYIDGRAVLTTEDFMEKDKGALEILDFECNRKVSTGSKICFVTANAGHGKTHLLRRYTFETAEKYQKNECNYIFLHIDLRGYDLRKLDEVIMYEVAGVLRMPGIYTNSIITLMKNGLIILGVDGFDELAVETEGEKAVGSFSNLVKSLDGMGTLIAASRRTFFNTQDYLAHKGIFDDVTSVSCYFDELKLMNWGEKECMEYLSYYTSSPKTDFDNILGYLGHKKDNPLIERPFLFTNIVKYAYQDNQTSAYDFLRQGNASEQGIERIISAFIRREVEKWNNSNLKEKKEYLSFEQHEELLADVAIEMWRSQRDYISLDILEFDLSMLLDEWHVLPTLHPDIIKLAKSHAFLVADSHGDLFRRFDHDEFRNYFVARGMSKFINIAVKNDSPVGVKKLMAIGAFPESVAQYVAHFLGRDVKMKFLDGMMREVRNEYKTTYVLNNMGTFVPYLLHNESLKDKMLIDSRLIFSSLVFEDKTLANILFKNCTFVNICFRRTKMRDVEFSQCSFTEISFYENSDMEFTNVVVHNDCEISKITIYDGNNEIKYEEYAPKNIKQRLLKYGIERDPDVTNTEEEGLQINYESKFRKATKRFLNKFIKANLQYEKNLKDDPIYYSRYYDLYMTEIIPLMEKYNIIRSITNKNVEWLDTQAWGLKDYDLHTILRAEEDPTSPLFEFWREVNAHK